MVGAIRLLTRKRRLCRAALIYMGRSSVHVCAAVHIGTKNPHGTTITFGDLPRWRLCFHLGGGVTYLLCEAPQRRDCASTSLVESEARWKRGERCARFKVYSLTAFSCVWMYCCGGCSPRAFKTLEREASLFPALWPEALSPSGSYTFRRFLSPSFVLISSSFPSLLSLFHSYQDLCTDVDAKCASN